MQTAEQRKKRVHYKGIDLSCWYTAKNTRSPWRFAGLGAGWRNFGRLVEWCPTPEWCGGARLETGGTNRRSWDLFNGVGWCVFFVFSMVFVCFVWLRHTFFSRFSCFVVWCCNVKCCLLVDADHCHANFCTWRIGKHISQNISFSICC